MRNPRLPCALETAFTAKAGDVAMKKNSRTEGVTGFPSVQTASKSRRSSLIVKLPAELGIEEAGSLRETLMKNLNDARSVTLDASEIKRIHAAALQLFCMFCKDRRAAGRDVSWREPSLALRGAATLLGATTLLSLGQEPEAA
jgi:anti-anti-sigma regulatory factor